MSTSALASRTLTVIASAFLAFDGAALIALGWWGGRGSLVAVGTVLLLGSGLVFVLWRRQLRRLDEIAAARRELKQETEALRRLLGG